MIKLKRLTTKAFRPIRKAIKRLGRILTRFEVKSKKFLTSIFEADVLEFFSTLINFIRSELAIRPRARLALATVLFLALAFALSTKAVSILEAKEADVKIAGLPILVAEDNPQPEKNPEIVQFISALRTPFLYEKPVNGPISQGYTRYHRALDITSPLGTPVKPVGPGIVEFAGFTADGKGNVVIVDHGDGLKTLYAHMGRINVGAGNMVSVNTQVGTIGMTGRTTGPHVHFEVFDQGLQVNPKNLLP